MGESPGTYSASLSAVNSQVNTYRCIVKFGHVGSGRYAERAIYVRAPSVIRAMLLAKRRRGVKKGIQCRTGASVLAVERVN
jgi:hypothetical protein